MSQSVPWYGAGRHVPLLMVPTGIEGAGPGVGAGGVGAGGVGVGGVGVGVGGVGDGASGGHVQFDVPHCGHG